MATDYSRLNNSFPCHVFITQWITLFITSITVAGAALEFNQLPCLYVNKPYENISRAKSEMKI